MRYLVKQLGSTKAIAQMLRVSQRTVERYVKDQIKKPRPDLAARLEREVKKRWQPQIRAKARQRAATTGSIVIDTRARIGYTATIGSTDEDRLRHLTVALPPRYADDVRVFVRSRRAAQRVLASVTAVVEQRLKLKVNREKSKVVPASVMTMLGFGFYFTRGGKVRVRADPKAVKRLKMRLKELTSRRWSIAMDERIAKINRFTAGWMGYFQLADTPGVFSELDEWFRRRMRQIRWKEWKRYAARRRNLRALGMSERNAREWAGSSKGYWRIAGSVVLQRALPNSYWDDLGLHMLKPTWQRLRSAW